MSRLIAVLDANVLYGITPNRPDLDPDKITQRFVLMNRALDGASVPAPPSAVVDEMTNDIHDRHVLATAVTVGADVIVTENLRHVPQSACAPHGIVAMSLDDFIGELLDEQPSVVSDAITEMAGRRNHPPMTPEELLAILERYIPLTAQRLR